jgi:hypothetical protein
VSKKEQYDGLSICAHTCGVFLLFLLHHVLIDRLFWSGGAAADSDDGEQSVFLIWYLSS